MSPYDDTDDLKIIFQLEDDLEYIFLINRKRIENDKRLQDYNVDENTKIYYIRALRG